DQSIVLSRVGFVDDASHSNDRPHEFGYASRNWASGNIGDPYLAECVDGLDLDHDLTRPLRLVESGSGVVRSLGSQNPPPNHLPDHLHRSGTCGSRQVSVVDGIDYIAVVV